MQNKLIFLLCIILLTTLSTVIADILPMGYKSVEYCFRISNQKDYPNYTFYAHPILFNENGGYKLIKENECISFYKLVIPQIYAIKTSIFNEFALHGGLNEDGEFDIQFAYNIPSNINISSAFQIRKDSPIIGITDVIKIISINDSNLILEKSEVEYTYSGGEIETIAYLNQDTRPEPSKIPFTPEWMRQLWHKLPPFKYFIFTFLIEFSIFYFFIRKEPIKLFLYSVLLNSLTLPIASFLFFKNPIGQFGWEAGSILFFFIIEFGVFVVESLLLKWLLKLNYSKTFLISFVANLVTSMISLLLLFI
jgi:hypothetical protein